MSKFLKKIGYLNDENFKISTASILIVVKEEYSFGKKLAQFQIV